MTLDGNYVQRIVELPGHLQVFRLPPFISNKFKIWPEFTTQMPHFWASHVYIYLITRFEQEIPTFKICDFTIR